MKRTLYILVGLLVGALAFGPFSMATDGTNGTSGPAMLDYDTDQLFDSQDPPHYLVAGSQTMTLTGHGTTTLAGATVYAGSNIVLRGTATSTSTALATAVGSGTATNTGTDSCTSTVTVYGTVTGTSGATATGSGLTTASGACTATLTATGVVGATVTNTSTTTSTVTASATSAFSSYFVASKSSGTQDYLPMWSTPYELTDSPVSWAGGLDPVNVNADLQCVGSVSAANILTTPTAYGIPKADDANKIADGWLEDHYLYGVGGIAFSYKTGTDTVTSTGTVVNTKLNPTISNTSTFTATTTSVATHTFRSVNSNLLFGSDSNSVTATETAVTTDVYVFINAKTASATYSIPQSGSSGKIGSDWLDYATSSATSKIVMSKTDGKIDTSFLPGDGAGRIQAMYTGTNAGVVSSSTAWTDVATITYSGYGGTVMAWGVIRVKETASPGGGGCSARIQIDGTTYGTELSHHMNGYNTYGSLSPIAYASGLSASSHTITLQLATMSSTCEIAAGQGFVMAQVISQ